MSECQRLAGLLPEGDVVQGDRLQAHHPLPARGEEEEERKEQAGSEHHNTPLPPSLSQSKVRTNSSHGIIIQQLLHSVAQISSFNNYNEDFCLVSESFLPLIRLIGFLYFLL